MASKNFEISDLLDCYGGILTEKQRLLCEYYYNDDLSLAEIAQNEGITRQGVHDTIKRAETQLYECENKLGLCNLLKLNTQKANKICECAQKIIESDDNINNNELARNIISLAKDI